MLMGLGAGAVALWVGMPSAGATEERISRAAAVAFTLALVSPAQFPWYMIWMIPFLPFRPLPALALVSVTSPLYYTLFHFSARGTYEANFLGVVVWVIWLPVWLLLADRAFRWWRSARPAQGGGLA